MSIDVASPSANFQAVFASSLLIPTAALPTEVIAHRGKATVRRFNVYRNNVVVSLIDALKAVYPAVERITGSEFFRAMARAHIRQTPPASPLLFEYGREFPDFIDRYPYARELPWLADVARIERAWLDAYHGRDANPLMPETLATVPTSRLDDLCFVVHPATRIVRSSYPATSIFTINRAQGPVPRFESSIPEDALITRPGMEVGVRNLPPGGAVFLLSLIAGRTLSASANEAFAASSSFDLATNIAGLLEAGAFTAVT